MHKMRFATQKWSTWHDCVGQFMSRYILRELMQVAKQLLGAFLRATNLGAKENLDIELRVSMTSAPLDFKMIIPLLNSLCYNCSFLNTQNSLFFFVKILIETFPCNRPLTLQCFSWLFLYRLNISLSESQCWSSFWEIKLFGTFLACYIPFVMDIPWAKL